MFLKILPVAPIAALAIGIAIPGIGDAAPPSGSTITCTNPASGASWQIKIDYAKGTVDSNPAQISDDGNFLARRQGRRQLHA